MKKSLKRTDRGISHHLNLKNDLENSDDRITTSLPLFIRIMFYDTNPWIKQINRFDFLRLATLHKDFGKLDTAINFNISYSTRIVPSDKDRQEIALEDFFESHFISVDETLYTIKEFVFALAYNGGIHMIPDKKFEEKYTVLYESLFEKYPNVAFDITEQISKVLVQIFDEFYSLLVGSNDAHSLNAKFAPKIAEDGKILEGILFSHSYLQFPIREKEKKGIRFCVEIKIRNQMSKNIIFEYGHRENDHLKIKLFQSNKHIILEARNLKDAKILRFDLKEKATEFYKVEIALYPNGNLILAIDNFLVGKEKLEGNISIIDGKVILGSNLAGNQFGDFYEKTIVVQSIDRSNEFRVLNAYSLKKLQLLPQNISYNQLKRDFIS